MKKERVMRLIDADPLIAELEKDEEMFDREAEDGKQNPQNCTVGYAEAMWSRANGIRDAIISIYGAPTIDAVEIVRCGKCKHKPYPSDDYNYDNGDCGFEIIFPDYRCPCRCEDEYYNRIPDDDWYCGNGERKE